MNRETAWSGEIDLLSNPSQMSKDKEKQSSDQVEALRKLDES